MEKEFIPYEQALALKELGFDEECLGRFDPLKVIIIISRPKNNSYYKGSVPSFLATPLYQQAFRWFREKYGIFSSTWCFETEHKFFIEFGFGIQKFEVADKENTELACLKKLIEIVKNK